MTRQLRTVAAALALTACTSGGPAPTASRSPTSAAVAPPTSSPSLSLAFRDLPAEFYGVLGGRIAAFDSVTGTRRRWLTEPPAGYVDGSPSVVESDRGPAVVFLRTHPATPCDTARILRVGVDGGAVGEVHRPGGVVTLADTGGDGGHVAFAYRNCGAGIGSDRVRIIRLSDGFVVRRGRTTGTIEWLMESMYSAFVRVRDRRGKTWLASVGSTWPDHETDIDRSSRVPVPAGCDAGRVVYAGSPGLPGWSTYALRATLKCATADGYELRPATYPPGEKSPEVGAPVARAPAFYELTSYHDSGYLLGVRGEDDGTRYVRRVVQVAGIEERVLGPCESADGTADACVTEPVW